MVVDFLAETSVTYATLNDHQTVAGLLPFYETARNGQHTPTRIKAH